MDNCIVKLKTDRGTFTTKHNFFVNIPLKDKIAIALMTAGTHGEYDWFLKDCEQKGSE